jgi:hypothetical protein
MFRFTIRDMLWLMVVVGVCLAWIANSRRWASIETRLQAAERFAAEARNRYDAVTKESKTNSEAFEALADALRQADLSYDQRKAIGKLFVEGLETRGVEIKSGH